MDASRLEERGPLLGRLAGITAIVFVIDPLGIVFGGPNFFANLSSQQILDSAAKNGRAISIHAFNQGLGSTLFALFIILLVVQVRGRGILATLAYLSAAAMMAVNWTAAGMQYALADAAQRAGSESGVVALFSLGKMMAFSDGYFVAIPAVAISVIALRSRALPVPICWLGLAAGAFHFLATPIQLVLTGTADGVTGPIAVVTGLLWLLAVGVTLLVKPVWGPQSAAVQARATA